MGEKVAESFESRESDRFAVMAGIRSGSVDVSDGGRRRQLEIDARGSACGGT